MSDEPEQHGTPPAQESSLTEEVRTTLTPQERRAKRWAETKTDFKWATALLFVLILSLSGALWGTWRGPLAGEEDLDAVTTLIFSPDGLVAPFEILSVLLLAALVAGVAMALRDPVGGDEDAPWRTHETPAPAAQPVGAAAGHGSGPSEEREA